MFLGSWISAKSGPGCRSGFYFGFEDQTESFISKPKKAKKKEDKKERRTEREGSL